MLGKLISSEAHEILSEEKGMKLNKVAKLARKKILLLFLDAGICVLISSLL